MLGGYFIISEKYPTFDKTFLSLFLSYMLDLIYELFTKIHISILP